MSHATSLHHATHHHGTLQEPLPTVEVDQTGSAQGLPGLPPSILSLSYYSAAASSGADGSGGAGGGSGDHTGGAGGSLGAVVGDGGEGAGGGVTHDHDHDHDHDHHQMAVGTPPATRKRGRPRKPPTPYNCAFVGCQKQITKRRFCAAHQKRRERARKKAQQQQQQQIQGQPTDVGGGVPGVGEDQQALLANLPPLPPMLQEAAVAGGPPLMMPFQLQMMAELSKQQQSYEQEGYNGQHHAVAQEGYETHGHDQPAYDIAQQAYEQQVGYATQQEESYEETFAVRKRKREDEEGGDTSPETIAQTDEQHMPGVHHHLHLHHHHHHDTRVGDQQGEASHSSELLSQEDQLRHAEQDRAQSNGRPEQPHQEQQQQQEHWSATTLVVGQEPHDHAHHHHHHHHAHHHHRELEHELAHEREHEHELAHEHEAQSEPMEFQVVEGEENPHLPPQQADESKSHLPTPGGSGHPGPDPDGQEARWI